MFGGKEEAMAERYVNGALGIRRLV